MCWRTTPCSASGLPKAVRERARLHAAIGDVLAHHALLGQRLAEGGARARPFAHHFERALGLSDGAHAMVDAPGTEPALRDLEAAPLAQDHVIRRHAHILEVHLAMAVRRIVIAEDGERADHRDAGRVNRHQHHRMLLVARSIGVALAHEDENLAARIGGARGPPFQAVDHIVIAVALDARLEVGGIG